MNAYTITLEQPDAGLDRRAVELGPVTEAERDGIMRPRRPADQDIAAVKLACKRPGSWALIHPSTQEPGRWQLTSFDAEGPWGHTCRDTVSLALALARSDGWTVESYELRQMAR